MALRLRGATSGYIELKAPASAGDNTLTLPVNNGSANQILKTDGNGNLSWVDDNSGVSLSGSTNNTITTVTGTNALQGEANLTFDGTTLGIQNDGSYAHVDADELVIGNYSTNAHQGITILSHTSKSGTIYFSDGDNPNGTSRGTFLYSHADDAFTFSTAGGTEDLRIDSSGKVGIGTTTPNSILDVRENKDGAETQIRLFNTDNGDTTTQTTAFYMSPDSRGTALTGLRSIKENADFSTNAGRDVSLTLNTLKNNSQTEGIRITSDGNVGIGTTSPSGKLTVRNTDDANVNVFEVYNDNGNMSGSFSQSSTGDGTVGVRKDDGTLSVFFRSNGISYLNGGSVGINTTSPEGKFAVDGSVAISSNNVTVSPSGFDLKIRSDTSKLGIHTDNASGTPILELGTGGSTGGQIFTTGTNPLRLGVNSGENMRIHGDGKVGIGTTSPSAKLHIIDGAGSTIKLGNTTNASTANIAYNWGGSFGLKCDPDDNAGGTKHIYMQVIGTTYFNLSSSGKVTCTGVNSLTTTGGSAVYVESDGDLLRYTSSRKYKTDIETAEDKYADEILTCRPVWYRSTSTNDIKDSSKTKSDFGWFGFIAEEIAEINPRLVNYKTKESQQQSDGTLKSVELDPSAYEAESVRYTDFIPLMVNLLKRQAAKIETLETKVAALESA